MPFIEPKNMDDCEARIRSLSQSYSGVCLELRLLQKPQDASLRCSYERKRTELIKRQTEMQPELRALKDWRKNRNIQLARQVKSDGEEIDKTCSVLVTYAQRARSTIQGMRLRIEELLSENMDLHRRLQELELKHRNAAPGEGREEWRQADNYDGKETHDAAR